MLADFQICVSVPLSDAFPTENFCLLSIDFSFNIFLELLCEEKNSK